MLNRYVTRGSEFTEKEEEVEEEEEVTNRTCNLGISIKCKHYAYCLHPMIYRKSYVSH